MKIAIFTEVMPPFVSGVSSYVDVLRKALARRGHKVVVVTSVRDIPKTFEKNGTIFCKAKDAPNKYGLECRTVNDPFVIKFFNNRFRPDVVHIHTDTRIGYMGLMIADRFQVPVVFTVHDNYNDRFASKRTKIEWNIRTYFEKKHFCDMIDNAQVISSSNKRAAQFVQEAGRSRNVMVVPTAVDMKMFDYTRSSSEAILKIRKKLGLPPRAVAAVFAGDLSVDKNLEFVLNAFSTHLSRSENIHLLIVGDGTERRHLQNLTEKLKIGDRIHFVGEVSNSLMPEIYSACDVYVCSSEDSLMSMSFLEAIACGLPVLVKEDKEKFVYHMIRSGVNGFGYTDEESFSGYLKKFLTFSAADKAKLRKIVRDSLKKRDPDMMARFTENTYLQAIKTMRLEDEQRMML